MSKKEMVTLDNLGGGAAAEMFQDSLKKVIANIVDPNTKPDAVRSITLQMKIKPNKNQRDMCVVELSVNEKLATVLPFETAIFVGMQQGEAAATEYAPQQTTLFDQSQQQDEVESRRGAMVAIAGGR